MRWHFSIVMGGILSLSAISMIDREEAGAEVFVIDPAQSRVTLSGTYDNIAFSAQGPGSLTAAYQGVLNATVSSSNIEFTGSSRIAAMTNGTWKPGAGGSAGSAPADYGAQVTIPLIGAGYGAGRNIVLDITSPLLALTQTNFDSTQLIFSAVTNASPVFDYRNLLGSGSIPVSGNFTNSANANSTLSTNGDSLQLAIQVQATLTTTNGATLTLTGQLIATNSLSISTPPYITGMTISNQNLVLTVSNATAQSRLLRSIDLATWSSANVQPTTNGPFIQFTVPMSGPGEFFRVEK